MKPRTQDDYIRTALRVPPEMHAKVHAEASASGRTFNAQLIHMLQSYFDAAADEAATRSDGAAAEIESGISIGLHTSEDRAALIKSLLLSEVMLLKKRIEDFGGREAVLAATKQEIAEAAGRDVIAGTAGERRSLLSQVLPGYPLTSLFTDDELGKIADRVVLAQEAISGQRGKKP